MYQRILVAVDRSEISQQVLQTALMLANATGAALNLLHVLSYEDEHAPGLKEKGTVEYQRRWESFEQDGAALLQAYVEQTHDAGVMVDYELLPGKPGRLICDMAALWEADLIVIGRRRLSGLKEMILGSVSNYVAHSAPCAVLLVQGSKSALSSASTEQSSPDQ